MKTNLRYALLVVCAIVGLLGMGMYALFPSKTQSKALSGILADKNAALDKALLYLGNDKGAEVMDIRLIQHQEFAALMHTHPTYDGPDQVYKADSPVWAVALKSQNAASLPMFTKEQGGVVFYLSAGSGEMLGMQSLTLPKDEKTLQQLTALTNLDGVVEITPIEIKLPDVLPPTATPAPPSSE